jgi:uncharacterized membrane protein
MARELPPQLEKELLSEVSASLDRGRAVRRANVVQCALVLAALLAALAFSGVSEGFVIAVMVGAASLCISWTVMSASASLNAQFDQLAKIVVYYAEGKQTGTRN